MAIVTDAASPARPSDSGLRARVASSPLIDYYLVIFTVAILCAIGALMVLSASGVIAQVQASSPYSYAIRQLTFLALGSIAAIVLTRLPVDLIRRSSWLAWGFAVVALGLVLSPLGHHYNGNTNWLSIAGITFQPSEFAKLALILWGAAVLHVKRKQLKQPMQLLVPFIPGTGVLLALILAGRDLGTGIVVAMIILALLFFVGTAWRLLVPILLAGVGVVLFLLFGSSNRMDRVQIFLDPQVNTDLSSQPMAGLYALASGGWWGLGLGASKQKWGGLKDGAHTDYIFAVVGEELGLFGVVVVLVMFALLAKAGFSIAMQSDQLFNQLVASGITAWILIQGIINIMVVMHLLPVIGVPLPFVSYGGSALISNLLAVGVLLACARATPRVRRHLAAKKRKPKVRMTSVLAAGGGA